MSRPRARAAVSTLTWPSSEPSLSEIHSVLVPQRIPKADTPHEQAQRIVQRAGASLLAIGTCNFTSNQMAASKFLSDWSNIWSWIEYLHSQCVLANMYGEGIMVASILPIGCALKTLSMHDGLRNLIGSTTGVLSMVLYYWTKEPEGVDVHMQLADANGLFSQTLKMLLANAEHDPSVFTSIIDVVKGGADSISRISFVHLQNALDLTPISCLDVYVHVDLIGIFSSYPCLPLRAAVHSQNYISAIIKAANVVSESATDSVKNAIVETCYITFANILGTAHGPAENCRVLDNGLLASAQIQCKTDGLNGGNTQRGYQQSI